MKIYHYKIILFCLIILGSCTNKRYETTTKPFNYEPNITEDISFLDINAFAQDSLGYMWIATLGGLDRYNGYEFLHFSHQTSDSTSLLNDFVLSLLIDSSHNLWIGTSTGLNRYNYEKQCFEKYFSKYTVPIYSLFESYNGNIWVATPAGPGYIDKKKHSIAFLDLPQSVNLFWEDKAHHLWMGLNEETGLAYKKKEKWLYFNLPENRKVLCIYTDPQGKWWLGTNRGIIIFDPMTRSVAPPVIPTVENKLLNKVQINFIKEIEPLKLLIGTATEGFYYYDILSQKLLHNSPLRFNPQLSPQLHTYYADKQGNAWIGSYDKGFIIGNKHENNFNTNPILSNYFKDKFVTRIVEDSNKILWIATRYDGLYKYVQQQGIKKCIQFPEKGFLEDVYIDSKRRIWIAFEHQLLEGNITNDEVVSIDRQFNIDNVRVVKEDKQGNIWIGSWNGLYKLSINSADKTLQKVYTSNIPDICILHSGDILFSAYGKGIFLIKPNSTTIIPIKFPGKITPTTINCITIFEDTQQRIWIGSYGNGTLCCKGKTSISISTVTGLPNNNTLCFKEDLDGNIWMSTSHGISRISFVGNHPKMKNFFKTDGTLGDQFHEKAGCKTTDGRIFFAGNHGITFFNPSSIKPDNYAPNINIENFRIFNKSAQIGQKDSPLKKNILLTKQITLNHKQTTISLDYAGIDFLAPQKLTYKYRLEGFEEQWNYVGTFRRATYSNLPPGEYTFRVSAINGDGIESLHPATLKIIVKPAPWFTWQAWLFYILCTIGLTVFILKFLIKLRLNKQLAEMEHKERMREQDISQMKINFFTNISHELRTPLTLISAPLEKILSVQNDTNTPLLLNTISRNAHRLWQLVNQIMDFGKIENGTLRLHVQQIDIIALVRNIYETFIYIAERKKVSLSFHPHVTELKMWIDSDKIEKILYNLLSNAIKHTPKGKSIQINTRIIGTEDVIALYDGIQANKMCEYIEIEVKDEGDGIPPEKINDLFVRYRQIETKNGYKPDYSGNGIGLNYTKTLIEMHKGKIKATPQVPIGISFSFVLALGDIYTSEEKQNADDPFFIKPVIHPRATKKTLVQHQKKSKHSKYTILIAEDNPELLDFIAQLFEEKYNVIKTMDGQAAWQAIEAHTPDILISDIIMPGLSGYELCDKIKNNADYCQIPVVLLTSKTITDDKIKGLHHGADAYIGKPFATNELLLTIRNLLQYKENIRRYFATIGSQKNDQQDKPFHSADYIFLSKLNMLIESQLSNVDLNINDIASRLGMSRSVFYRKIKLLAKIPPNDFLRTYRLKRAAEMIEAQEGSLTEISERTGFNTYQYFSKVFKDHFGVSPKNYHPDSTAPNSS